MDEQFLKKLFADFAKRGIKLAAGPGYNYGQIEARAKAPPAQAMGALKPAPTVPPAGVKSTDAWTTTSNRPGPVPREYYRGDLSGYIWRDTRVPPGAELHGPNMPDYKAGPGMDHIPQSNRSMRVLSNNTTARVAASDAAAGAAPPPPPTPRPAPPPGPGPVTSYLSGLFQKWFH